MSDQSQMDVVSMDVDSEYKYDFQSTEDESKLIINNHTDYSDDTCENDSDEGDISLYKQYHREFGENCLYNLSYEELDEIYSDVYGEEPAFNMNKIDIIKCIEEYYNED